MLTVPLLPSLHFPVIGDLLLGQLLGHLDYLILLLPTLLHAGSVELLHMQAVELRDPGLHPGYLIVETLYLAGPAWNIDTFSSLQPVLSLKQTDTGVILK